MKVKLLKEVGIHPVGTIIDVDSTFVLQIEASETATRELDVFETKHVGTYTDLSGKEYTEEEVFGMDKRTNLYKEIMRK